MATIAMISCNLIPFVLIKNESILSKQEIIAMVAIAYIYFLSLLNVAIRADLVARGRESDLGANISMVETIGKRDERQAIIMAKWLFGFDFRGAVVECSGADCEPVIEIRIIRESGESGGDRGPVNGKFFFLIFQQG
tara:strand:- start:175 stop:585 length:411 start_codon:yes stop_codon:yes gene_type:complete